MSSCGGNCGCGSSCKCGDSCNGCGEFSDFSYLEKTTTVGIISGVVPVNKYHAGSSEMIASDGSHACKCGSNCTCDPCKC